MLYPNRGDVDKSRIQGEHKHQPGKGVYIYISLIHKFSFRHSRLQFPIGSFFFQNEEGRVIHLKYELRIRKKASNYILVSHSSCYLPKVNGWLGRDTLKCETFRVNTRYLMLCLLQVRVFTMSFRYGLCGPSRGSVTSWA